MAIKDIDELNKGRPFIDLTGPQGNAYFLFGEARKLASQLDKDGTGILARMQLGDYENLLKVFEEEFGEFIDLYR